MREVKSLITYFKVPQGKIGRLWQKQSKQKVRMSDDAMAINLQAPVFSDKEVEWQEFIVKFQAFLAMKRCTEAIQTNFKSKMPAMEDEELNVSTELGNAREISKDKECNGDGIHNPMFE